ncbi:homoserine kinase [Actinomycetaceae bacterium L2_0104]
MRIVHESARVRVPATSGNLGPGFDSMGMAHDLWDEVSVQASLPADGVEPSAVVHISGEGAGVLPTDESHLIVRSLRRALDHVGAPQPTIELTCINGILQGRGLGSSAAATVAGLLLARGLISDPEALDSHTVLRLAAEFEGHPDNAAPAVFGGAVVAWIDDDGAQAVPIAVSEDIRTSLLIPDAELLTEKARAVLPQRVEHRDAAFNASRTALLVLALEHYPQYLLRATEEKLHQDYRADAMPASAQALRALRAEGWPAVVSGAGPSLLVFAELDAQTRARMESAGFRVISGASARGAHLVH